MTTGPVLAVAEIPLLRGRPIMVVMLALLATLAAAYAADHSGAVVMCRRSVCVRHPTSRPALSRTTIDSAMPASSAR